MKIEQKTEQKFEPITLTIETKEELVLIMALLGGTTGAARIALTGKDVITNCTKLRQLALQAGITQYKFLDISVSKYTCELE